MKLFKSILSMFLILTLSLTLTFITIDYSIEKDYLRSMAKSYPNIEAAAYACIHPSLREFATDIVPLPLSAGTGVSFMLGGTNYTEYCPRRTYRGNTS